MSPFDVNMALDAGYDAVAPYTSVGLDEVAGLVQDAIFSRPPKLGARTGVSSPARTRFSRSTCSRRPSALMPPFEVSLFADPAGSFTTAAAMVAVVEKVLTARHGRELKGCARGVRRDRGGRLFIGGDRRTGRARSRPLSAMTVSARKREGAEIKARFGVDVAGRRRRRRGQEFRASPRRRRAYFAPDGPACAS